MFVQNKTACGAGTLQAEMKNINIKILSEAEGKIKSLYNEVRRTYYTTHNPKEFSKEIQEKDLCSVDTAIQILYELHLITHEEMYIFKLKV